jgi:NAD-dependent deacetylase
MEPAASLPFVALQSGAVIVEINPIHTPLTETVTYYLAGLSGEILPHLVDAVRESMN